MPKDRIAILFNPSAGKGAAKRRKARLERLLREWDVAYDLIVTQSAEDLRRLTRECAGSHRALAGAGGDSTFQIMADELLLAGAEVDFGLIPLGSSNDIAREFGVLALDEACRALQRSRTRKIDLGAVYSEGRLLTHFIGQANIGLGVQVNKFVEALARKRPRLASYQGLAGAVGMLQSFRRGNIPLDLSIRGEGPEWSGRFLVATFNNIRYWASGRNLLPSARPDDGRLDSCLIENCSFLRLARLALLARKGRHVGASVTAFLSAPAFRISSTSGFEIQADGEIIGGHVSPGRFKDIEIRAIPEALRLIC